MVFSNNGHYDNGHFSQKDRSFWYWITVILVSQVQSGRSKSVKVDGRAKVDGLEPNWTVIRPKVDGKIDLEKSKGRSGRSKSAKVDGLKVSK